VIAGVRRPVAVHIGWSAVGTVIPAVAALWAVPRYTEVLGAEGFALLAIVWSIVGWLSVADLGLSRAVTQGVAQSLATGEADRASATVWSATAVLAPAAALLAVAVGALAPRMAGWLDVGPERQEAATGAIRWGAAALPATILMTAWRGVLEGARAFRASALLRLPAGVAYALVPLWMATPDRSILAAVQGIFAVRVAALAAQVLVALLVVPAVRHIRVLDAGGWRGLLGFGGWTAVVNVAGAGLNSIDRIGLASLAPLGVMAPYAVASEAVMRVWIISAIIVPVQYAWFAALAQTDRPSAVAHYATGMRLISVVGFPVALLVAAMAGQGMVWWLGGALGPDAAAVARWMAVGVMANLGAQVAQAFVQAAGRPAYTALAYLVELPLMAVALMIVVPRAGAVGAAWVWSARCVLDAAWSLTAVEVVLRDARRARRGTWLWCFGTTAVVAVVAWFAR
jgi:O-antigen/teichoic acid export membrane protein